MSEFKEIKTVIELIDESTRLIYEALKQHYLDIDLKCEKKLDNIDLIKNIMTAPASLCKKVKLTNSEVIQSIAGDAYKAIHKGVVIKHDQSFDLCEEYRQLCIDEETIKNGIRSSIDAVREVFARKNGHTNKALNFLCNIKNGLADGSLTADSKDIIRYNESLNKLRLALLNYYLATFDQVSAHLCKRSSLPMEFINNTSLLITPTMGKKDEFLSAASNLEIYVSALNREELPNLNVVNTIVYGKKNSPYGALYALLKGEKAECQLCDYLQRNLKYSYILHGVRTERYVGDGKYSENDVVVINRHGIFSIEVKNIKSISEYHIYPNATEEAIRTINRKKEKYDGFKPLAQSSQHARSLRSFLIENNIIDELSTLSVVPMVAILNSTTKIIQENNAYINNIHYLSSDLIKYIENPSAKDVITDQEAFRIYTMLNKKSIALGRYNYGSNIQTIISSMETDAQRLYDALLPLSQNSLLILKASIPIKAERKRKSIVVEDKKLPPIPKWTFVPKSPQQMFDEGLKRNQNKLKENVIHAAEGALILFVLYMFATTITNNILWQIIKYILGFFCIILVLSPFVWMGYERQNGYNRNTRRRR